MVEDFMICLGKEGWSQAWRQILNQLFFLSMLWLLLDFRSLYNIICYLFESIGWNCSPFSQGIQNLQFLIFLKFILTNNIDKISNIVDIICKKQAGTERNDDNKKCFYIIARMQISKAYCQNYGGTKIITPNVFLIPRCCTNSTYCHPTIIRMDMCNGN